MVLPVLKVGGAWRNYMPHILMTLSQMGYTILYFITEASFNRGLNSFVYITYRHLVAAILVSPFAYFLERKSRPKMTWALFLEISILSFLGVSLTLNMYFASLKFTSPTFLTSMINIVPSLTLVVAATLGMEHLDLKNSRGMAKIAGAVISLAGVMIITLYKGSSMGNLSKTLIHMHGHAIHDNWIKGSLLAVASCIAWSVWYIMQAVTLKRYPAQLSLTALMSLNGGLQSAVFTALFERKMGPWLIGFDIRLWSILYGGIVCSGLIIFIQLWCTEEKGPVFVVMFNPLSTIMVALLAYFVFGERLYVGSIMGGCVVIVGLYLVLWGKDKEHQMANKARSNPEALRKEKTISDVCKANQSCREARHDTTGLP